MSLLEERLSVAPMMDWTDPHYRMFLRGITKRTVLYTEMVVDDTLLHTPCIDFHLGRRIEEQPSVVQLGGHDPDNLAKAAEYCARHYRSVLGGQYGEINLNCGCPSQRVSQRCFGAKLMLEPELVRQIVYSMQRSSGGDVPITVKCRIGADHRDSYEQLQEFIACAAQGGCRKFIIHARKCLLKGLSTKQNREIPPLRYEVVHSLQRDFPELIFVINGGIQTLAQAKQHIDPATGYRWCDTSFAAAAGNSCGAEQVLPAVHGAMIGRAAYSNPFLLATADSELYGVPDPCLTRRQALQRYIEYCEWCQSEDGPRYYVPPKSTAKPPHDQPKMKTVSTSVLLGAIRNSMYGLPNNQFFRTALNDLYQERLKGVYGSPNPDCRAVIEGAMHCLADEDLDRPVGDKLADKCCAAPLPARSHSPTLAAATAVSASSAVAIAGTQTDVEVLVADAAAPLATDDQLSEIAQSLLPPMPPTDVLEKTILDLSQSSASAVAVTGGGSGGDDNSNSSSRNKMSDESYESNSSSGSFVDEELPASIQFAAPYGDDRDGPNKLQRVD